MALIVQKFGGSSVADITRIKKVAAIIKAQLKEQHKIVVIVSAMQGVTDQLVKWAKNVSNLDKANQLAEYDVIVSSGEQVTSGLLALALEEIGISSRSWLAWQLPIKTDDNYSQAAIEEINNHPINLALAVNQVAIIAGFQGISNQRLTTLGRGGSDTSAVAIAASLQADRCDIYTDVDGIYTADPSLVDKATRLSSISYLKMLELASAGAKVLQTRAVTLAFKYQVPVRILSSFNSTGGTILINDDQMEKNLITAIAHNFEIAQLIIYDLADQDFELAMIFEKIADAQITVDSVEINNQELSNQYTTLKLIFNKDDLSKMTDVLKHLGWDEEKTKIRLDLAKISVIGIGLKSNSRVLTILNQALNHQQIKALSITVSETTISALIKDNQTKELINKLHQLFGLDN